MTLKDELINLRKNFKVEIVKLIENRVYDLDELVEISLSDDAPQCWRAAWAVSWYFARNTEDGTKYLSRIIKKIPISKHHSQSGCLLQVLLYYDLGFEQLSDVYDFCISELTNMNNPAYLKHRSLKLLVKMIEQEPELLYEIKPCVELAMENWDKRYLIKHGRQILKMKI